jgi:hypothetical protein
LDRSTPIDWDKLNGCAQTHEKFLLQTHINPTNRLQQYKVFAELFSKSDRLPFPNAPHLPHFTAKGHRQKAMTFDFFIAPDIPEDPI